MDLKPGAKKPDNKSWGYSTTLTRQVECILTQNAIHIVKIELATPQDDMKRATDFYVVVKGGCVAVRIRDIAYRNRGYDDLTIRAINNGYKTELDKLREGHADWYLYGWKDEDGIISAWRLLDINTMRRSGILNENRQIKINKDGRTGFVCYTMDELRNIGAIAAECSPCFVTSTR